VITVAVVVTAVAVPAKVVVTAVVSVDVSARPLLLTPKATNSPRKSFSSIAVPKW
jgi:hypothetical protein